jgi:SAM-dependent methyltransferase
MVGIRIDKIKEAVPWFVKIPAKIVLSRARIGARQWQRLNLFRAGAMDTPAWALAVFQKHLQGAGLATLTGRRAAELGPGNGLLTALFAKALGAEWTWLVDAQELASDDVGLFSRAAEVLSAAGLPVPELPPLPSMTEALQRLNASYLTQGLASMRTIPDGTVDFLFSNAVLEHVRLREFAETCKEMRRILKPTGVASHQIDFRDHLQNGLNNLRFSSRVWESDFMVRSGFYTNRLTLPAMDKMFREAGLSVELRTVECWPHGLPTPQSSMAAPFRDLPEQEMMVQSAHVLLRPTP